MGKIIYGLYDDEEILMDGARKIREKGLYIKDVYSPFPIHGLDKVLGIPWTRLAIVSFVFGITGTVLAILGMWYFMVYDWPLNIGGKPSFSLIQNLPSFIPVTFEFTVLCAAHGMAITYLLRNWTLPGVTPKNPHPRTTDDRFAMEIHEDHNSGSSEAEIKKLLTETGAVEVFEK